MTDSSLLDIDELQIYCGDPFEINDKIIVYQPTIEAVKDFGESKYYSVIHTLTCIPSDMKSQLADKDIDYETLDDFELFIMLTRGLTPEMTGLVLGELDLSKFIPCTSSLNNELILYDKERNITIDKFIYLKMVTYIRKLHNIKPKVQKAGSKTVKKILIQLDRERIQKAKNEPYKSQLKPLISAMMRYPGCCMTLKQILELPLCAFMDLVQGSQIYVSSTALLQGSYSGMIDTSKIEKKEFNWMRSLDN